MGLVNIRKATIFIIEPTAATAALLTKVLVDAKFAKVVTASSGQEAVQKLATTKADAVLLDWTLPDIPAAQLLKALRGKDKKLGVIVISEDPNAETEAKAAGASAFFPAPFKTAALLKALDDLMLARLGIAVQTIGEREK